MKSQNTSLPAQFSAGKLAAAVSRDPLFHDVTIGADGRARVQSAAKRLALSDWI